MSVNRLVGLTSGMDTDSLIKDLMKLEQSKIDKVEKEKQYTEWEQEAYRSVIKSINSFKSEYFDILKSDNNFRSATAFSEFNENITVGGASASSYLSVTGTPKIGTFNHTIDSITRLATHDEWKSDDLGLSEVSGGTIDFVGDPQTSVEFSLSIDGATKTIAISSGLGDQASLVAALNTEIENQFGADYSSVVKAGPSDSISFSFEGSEVTVLETTGHEAELTWLGFTSGESTSDYKNETLNDLFSITDADLTTMTINGVALSDLSLTENSNLNDLTKALSNSSDVAVDLVYNETNDTFTLTADNSGTANIISMSADFKSKLKFDTGIASYSAAENAELVVDGTTIIKSSNSFTLDGIQYDLKQTYTDPDPIEISIETDTEGLKEKITEFVETYNGMVELLNGLMDEKREYDYEPLTDEEKEAMTEDDIEKWEAKAKSGILKNDTVITNMLSKMRTALYEQVEGVGLTFADIGIQTSSDYKEGGKLVIDDAKLTDALENDYESVVDLFTNESDKEYLDRDNSTERYNENGLANRLYDIMQDAVRTTRDEDGYKGLLLEKAGIEKDASVDDNTLSETIKEIDIRIQNMYNIYYEREEAYYIQFGRMESALAEMQAQSSSMMAQLG